MTMCCKVGAEWRAHGAGESCGKRMPYCAGFAKPALPPAAAEEEAALQTTNPALHAFTHANSLVRLSGVQNSEICYIPEQMLR